MTHILVAEDEGPFRTILVEVLTEAGFQIVEAETADEAVPLLQTEGVRLVVTDIDMPGRLDGLDLALAARHAKSDMPVIFMTGSLVKLAEAQILLDPVSFLLKPFSWSKLLSDIDRLNVCPSA